MSKPNNGRGERAIRETVAVLDQMRASLVRRLDNTDLEAMRKRGVKWYGSMRKDVNRRMRPRRRGFTPGLMALVVGATAIGATIAGLGYVAYDRERREAARKRLDDVRTTARQRYTELAGRWSQNGDDLQRKVELAIRGGGEMPEGLEVMVEGRTVYLRGAVPDPSVADRAAERAHSVPGVVAVVNLTTGQTQNQHATATART